MIWIFPASGFFFFRKLLPLGYFVAASICWWRSRRKQQTFERKTEIHSQLKLEPSAPARAGLELTTSVLRKLIHLNKIIILFESVNKFKSLFYYLIYIQWTMKIISILHCSPKHGIFATGHQATSKTSIDFTCLFRC